MAVPMLREHEREKQLESHRREITALFCDLRGFTGFSESADPEDVMTVLREYHEALGRSIVKYSGTLERYAGDRVMVVSMTQSQSRTPHSRPC
jgi:adenylate cyclase